MQKAIRLIDYLLKLASLRTKPVHDIADYERRLWLSSIPHERGCITQAWGQDEELNSADIWVQVQGEKEPELPSVHDMCKDWVDGISLRNTEEPPELPSEINIPVKNPAWRQGSDEPEHIFQSIFIKDNPDVKNAWEYYVKDKWSKWREKYIRWKSVHDVYTELFAIHQEQSRLGEKYELVLGLGLLTWKTPSGQRVCRHLIVANALLSFEASLGKFTVCSMQDGAAVRPELDMLDIEERPERAEETAKSSLSNANDNPWENTCIEGVLKALVHSIGPQGEYDNTLNRKNIQASEKPVVEYAPALILRKRSSKGLTETLNKIKDNIEKDGEIPGEFGDLAELRQEVNPEPDNDPQDTNRQFDGEVFFPKPANKDQRRIIDKLQEARGLLVQGPPGTGKSHTIANLICHLLATGKRTLITAKTPRALQVLKELVPGELQPLCINLLGSGLEEKQSLESSVNGMLRKYEEWNQKDTDLECENLEQELQKLRKKSVEVNRQLRDIRESEIHSQSVAEGYSGTAARIAEAVKRDRSTFAWFTDAAADAALARSCPVSEGELQGVLGALRRFTAEKRRELNLAWPEVGHLPSAERFADLVQDEAKSTEQETRLANGADEHTAYLLSKINATAIKAIRDSLSFFQKIHRKLVAMPHTWIPNSLSDVMRGHPSLWHKRYIATKNAISSIETLVADADNASIDYPDGANIRALKSAASHLKKHMKNGGKLGWWLFRSKVVKEHMHIIKAVRVDGCSCSTVEHFSTLHAVLHVRIGCEDAWKFWEGQAPRVQGPYSLQLQSLKALRDTIKEVLSFKKLIDLCRNTMRQCPDIQEPVWSDESQIEKLIASCRLALAHLQKNTAEDKIRGIEESISVLAAENNPHPVTNDFLQAIRNRDVTNYAKAMNKVQNLNEDRQNVRSINEDVERLRKFLPNLMDKLKRTYEQSYWDNHLRDIRAAWHWEWARRWIEEYIRKEDAPTLVKRAKQIEKAINDLIAKLASLLAWSFYCSRLQDDHRRHMEAWKQAVRRLGKGTGKHAPRHRRAAQQHLNQCREAVPAWIMPLHRVWDTVAPSPGMFDVVIVDEASQCGVEALPLFYLAKKILIVGDDKQISPDAVGVSRDAVHRLIQEFLHDFEFRSAFDVESSLFDHGKLRYGTQRITLREHFRCMPEIIRFSNDLCYFDTPLIPLRQYGADRLPPLEHILVEGGYREGSADRAINRLEAKAIVEKIMKLCQDERYSDKSIGVVVLQGEAQADLIERDLLEKLGAEEMEKRRLVCGKPYSFQGDERDIMILSMVAASNMRIGPFTTAADERRFNVAASRARDQMYLFHSVTSNDLSNSCLRRRLLEFFENTTPPNIAGIPLDELEQHAYQDNRGIVSPPAPFESWFEVDVALALLRKRFQVLPQYEVAGKRIDLVVNGGEARLAVECDGDHWHGAEHYEADMDRQRQLERCGWEFFRVRESAFRLNPESALTPLWQMLADRGIR